MGIRFYCPNGHKLNVKSFLAGMRGICPHCGARVNIPLQSTRPSSKELRRQRAQAAPGAPDHAPVAAEQARTEAEAEFEARLALPSDADNRAAADASAPGNLPPQQSGGSTGGPAPMPGPGVGQVPDPLEEAPDASWYVIPPTGGQYGPASASVMRTWLAEGRIGPDSLVWREGWPDWKEARHVFPQVDLVGWPGGQAVVPDPIVSEPVASAVPGAGGAAGRQPARTSRRFEIALVAILVPAVVLLLGVFLWVMYFTR